MIINLTAEEARTMNPFCHFLLALILRIAAAGSFVACGSEAQQPVSLFPANTGGPMAPSGVPDSSCPSVDVAPGMTVPGCCVMGMCGVDGSAFNNGCVELGMAATFAMQGGFGLQIPTPRACGG